MAYHNVSLGHGDRMNTGAGRGPASRFPVFFWHGKVGGSPAEVPGASAQLEDKEGKSKGTDSVTFSAQGIHIKGRL